MDTNNFTMQNSIKEFKSVPYYSKEYDTLTYYLKCGRSYSVQINESVSIMKSIETDEITGIKIHSVQEFLKQFIESLKNS